MVISMTGFGRSKVQSQAFSVNVEVKTVNHRFCEINIRMPRQLLMLEDKMKKKITQHLRRGRVEVFVTIEGDAAITRKVQVDWKLLEEYFHFLNQAREKFHLEGQVTLQDLLNRSELIHIIEDEAGNVELENLVLTAIEEAALQLKQMRTDEGKELKKDLLTSLKQLEITITELQQYAPLVVRAYKERLGKRIQEFVEGQLDETRMLTEVAVFADKVDINEEITRLNSHIQQFKKTLNVLDPIGRKLDFIVQEMNREANTIGSKANDSSIAEKVVDIKSLIEKLKEQVQNIE
ncbi:YicC/YloC family endoribonuclease [Bacillus sp. MRMR6]|uniref:YicC/YloC family endoribonuclease n=1 Tax=Bacillus sp. MRMR6 TaxID=1928617 RepID=UPI0009517DFC|nr:YicC/YloC family endoribonuclease [Bacillus sp. MRMR6]OLS42048.1 YicC family protein [Bacillus sp. MRMR6]